ncbi:MAG: prohibitin family protein [Candidatus Hydrogenedentota bacterium]|nr:MAG: prohibitin family protein [Candidatus Hydrogenedentota bacterium]
MSENQKTNKWVVQGIVVLLLFIALIIINPFVVIGAGERGVVVSRVSGVQMTPLGEGMHFVMPFVYSVERYDVRTMKFESESECSTADLQDIKVRLAINYKIDAKEVARLHQQIGPDYVAKVIVPAMEESIKASTAKFKIAEVITKREELRNHTLKLLREKLKNYFIILQDVSIMNISFSEAYSKSVEEKQIQDQKIKTKEYERRQAEEEARRVRILADAKAYEQSKLARSVSPDVVKLEWIKKWDGKLPQYMGGNSNILMPMK